MTIEDQPLSASEGITFTLPEERCHTCGTTEAKLYPSEEPMGPGVVRDTVFCVAHLEAKQ